ncbi:EAL domain-containing protein [Trinickia terrae]|uniref:EAL domain-containing protein n=1 Tax=Trinickia terrae TaxID=2571161 RepID=A0A4V5PJJ9_9BURK|nr:EAL domain-containing protein [Trinickia terrae]TKC88780.1 EAL domain-containing protein [Trinickia terrae]
MTKKPARWLSFLTIIERIDRRPYFIAIRRGLALPLPLIMSGALALLLRYPSSVDMHRWLMKVFGPRLDFFCDNLLAGTFGIGALVALYGFADALTNLHNQRLGHRHVNPTVATIVVVSCFFTLIAGDSEGTLSASLSLGRGMLGALLVASLGGCLFLKLCGIRCLRVPLRNLSNDPLVGDVFTVLPAGMLTILLFALLKVALFAAGGSNFIGTLSTLLAAPFSKFSTSPLFGVGYETASQVLWLFGIHGPNALYAVQEHVLVPASNANIAAVVNGGHLQFIFTYDFFAAFARMGGSGGTLSLILALLLVSRTVRGRKLALFMMLPALFNVNEPLLFGLPLVLNPVYAIPFILAPVVQILIAYAAIVVHLMPQPGYSIAWTTPVLYSGYAVTGSFSGTLVQLLALVAGTMVYVPFVLMAEYLAGKRGQEVLASLLHIAESPETGLKAKRCLDLPGEEGRMAVALASDLEDAVKTEGQIFLEFQPQVDFRTGRVFGAEALLRWQHPFLGRVAPPVVVAIADDAGQTDRLGLQILSLACRQRNAWREVLPDDFVMAVNLSPRQLLDREFHRKVLDILRREQLRPSWLELEITESTMLLPDVIAIDNLRRLREVGVKVALDDFGMGHTSLHYLRELPLDTVKIDRALADVSPGSVNEHIVKSVADLSRTLNLSLVVEGVENECQLKCLSALGCDRFQGYFFSRPLAAHACLEFVTDANWGPGFTA